MTTTKQQYRRLKIEHPIPWCWACGRSEDYSDKPRRWYADWWIERSHIVRNPRVCDARLCVLLCSACHQAAHGARLILKEERDNWPRLTLANLLWLKSKFDPDYYDRQFIRLHSIGNLPRAAKPPLCYLLEYHKRRGDFYRDAG